MVLYFTTHRAKLFVNCVCIFQICLSCPLIALLFEAWSTHRHFVAHQFVDCLNPIPLLELGEDKA